MLVAILALFVALAGTVYASGKLNGKKIKPNSIPVNRLKGTIPTDRLEGNGPPLAYAGINANGTVAGHAKGIASANVNSAGLSSYCFRGLPTLNFALTSPGYQTNQNTDVTAKVTYADFPGSTSFSTDCPGAQVEVTTTVNGAFAQAPFFIAVFK